MAYSPTSSPVIPNLSHTAWEASTMLGRLERVLAVALESTTLASRGARTCRWRRSVCSCHNACPCRTTPCTALRVPVELAVALQRVAAAPALVEVVHLSVSYDSHRVPRGPRRARVRRVGAPGLAAVSSHEWLLLGRSEPSASFLRLPSSVHPRCRSCCCDLLGRWRAGGLLPVQALGVSWSSPSCNKRC
jgi:hypothetical protein